jgi:hypothetical protein
VVGVCGLVCSRWEKACRVLAWDAGPGVTACSSSFLHVPHQPIGPSSEGLSNPNSLALWVAREGYPGPAPSSSAGPSAHSL